MAGRPARKTHPLVCGLFILAAASLAGVGTLYLFMQATPRLEEPARTPAMP